MGVGVNTSGERNLENDNIQDVIRLLSNAIGTGNTPGGNSVNVGIYDSTALFKISQAVRAGIDGSFKNGDAKKNADKITEVFGESIDDSSKLIERQLKELGKTFGEHIREYTNNIVNSIHESWPMLTEIAQGVLGVVKSLNNFYRNHAADIIQLHDKGVNVGPLGEIFKKSGEIGISSEKVVEALSNNSEMVAKLSGNLNAKDNNPFYRSLEMVKKLSMETGRSFNSMFESAKFAIQDFSDSAALTNESFDIVLSKSKQYATFLDKLSKATGKSAESIAKEAEARDKETTWRALSMDPRNKAKISTMTALGWSTDLQIATLTGMPNEESVMASFTPGFNEMQQSIQDFKGDNEIDLVKSLKIIAEKYSGDVENQIKYIQDNPAVANAMKDVFSGVILLLNALNLDIEKLEEDSKTQKFIKTYEEVQKAFDTATDKWKQFLMTFTPFFTETLKAGLDIMNYFLKEIFGIEEDAEQGENETDEALEKRRKDRAEKIQKAAEAWGNLLRTFGKGIVNFMKKIKNLFKEVFDDDYQDTKGNYINRKEGKKEGAPISYNDRIKRSWFGSNPEEKWSDILKKTIGDPIINAFEETGKYIWENNKTGLLIGGLLLFGTTFLSGVSVLSSIITASIPLIEAALIGAAAYFLYKAGGMAGQAVFDYFYGNDKKSLEIKNNYKNLYEDDEKFKKWLQYNHKLGSYWIKSEDISILYGIRKRYEKFISNKKNEKELDEWNVENLSETELEARENEIMLMNNLMSDVNSDYGKKIRAIEMIYEGLPEKEELFKSVDFDRTRYAETNDSDDINILTDPYEDLNKVITKNIENDPEYQKYKFNKHMEEVNKNLKNEGLDNNNILNNYTDTEAYKNLSTGIDNIQSSLSNVKIDLGKSEEEQKMISQNMEYLKSISENTTELKTINQNLLDKLSQENNSSETASEEQITSISGLKEAIDNYITATSSLNGNLVVLSENIEKLAEEYKEVKNDPGS